MTGRTLPRRSAERAAALALAPVLALSVAAAPAAAPVPEVDRTIARGLSAPWDLAFLPDGSAFVSERDSAKIKLLDGAGGVASVGTVPGVTHGGEGGLLGIAVAPDFDAKPYLYAYFTAEKDNRIVRMAYKARTDAKPGTLGKPKVLLGGIPGGFTHNGGRIAFGPDGMLYAGTGETGVKKLAQQRSSLGGKILRLTRAGKIPADNPTRGSYVYSRGHRNVQGLAFDAKGRLFASEFGQNTWDELNLIRPGGNTGWPMVEGKAEDSRYDDPIAQWKPERGVAQRHRDGRQHDLHGRSARRAALADRARQARLRRHPHGEDQGLPGREVRAPAARRPRARRLAVARHQQHRRPRDPPPERRPGHPPDGEVNPVMARSARERSHLGQVAARVRPRASDRRPAITGPWSDATGSP